MTIGLQLIVIGKLDYQFSRLELAHVTKVAHATRNSACGLRRSTRSLTSLRSK